jgi:hypothetical protein
LKRFVRRVAWAIGITICLIIVAAFTARLLLQPPQSPDEALKEADQMAWLNNWIGAEPLYRKAELQFAQRREWSKAMYARVSQMPAHMESRSLQEQIWILTQELSRPEAQDPQTRLRTLVVKGIIENNYDAATARSTWESVEGFAKHEHQFLLAARASGEGAIAAFLLGDIGTA